MIEAVRLMKEALNDIESDARYCREKAASATDANVSSIWILRAEICDDCAALLRRRVEEAVSILHKEADALRALFLPRPR